MKRRIAEARRIAERSGNLFIYYFLKTYTCMTNCYSKNKMEMEKCLRINAR